MPNKIFMSEKKVLKKPVKIILGIIIAIAALIVLPRAARFVKAEKKYREAIRLIKIGEYEKGGDRLLGLDDYKYSDELENYAFCMMHKDSNISMAYYFMCGIPTDYDGPFADEVSAEREIIKERYDEYSIIYEQEKEHQDKKTNDDKPQNNSHISHFNDNDTFDYGGNDTLDYDDLEDFYYDNPDDFEDYEDAEDYYDEYYGD